jgi:hypothetical protein
MIRFLQPLLVAAGVTVLGALLPANRPAAMASDCGCGGPPACGQPPAAGQCCHGCARQHCKRCCAAPPQGVVLPSAPAMYFGASTFSVVPAGLATQGLAAAAPGRNLTESELLMLLRSLQSQGVAPQGAATCSQSQGTGAAPRAMPGQGAGTAAPPPASGASVDQRLAQVEAEVRDLRRTVDVHTNLLTELVKDPALQQRLRVQP